MSRDLVDIGMLALKRMASLRTKGMPMLVRAVAMPVNTPLPDPVSHSILVSAVSHVAVCNVLRLLDVESRERPYYRMLLAPWI